MIAKKITAFLLLTVFFVGCEQKQPKMEAFRTAAKPTIDGGLDAPWQNADWQMISGVSYMSTETKKPSISAKFKVLWDTENCYVFVRVKDDIKFKSYRSDDRFEGVLDFNPNIDEMDGVHVCFFADGYVYGETHDVYQFKFIYGYNDILFEYAIDPRFMDQTKFRRSDNADGYDVEVSIPWKVMGKTPKKDNNLGFRVTVIDNDNHVPEPGLIPKAESVISWSGADIPRSKYYGRLKLVDQRQ